MAALYGDLPEAKLIEAPKVTPISTSDQLDRNVGGRLEKNIRWHLCCLSPQESCVGDG